MIATTQASQHGPSIAYVDDLQALTQLARVQKLPIMLYIAALDCSYCELLEEEILLPMLLSEKGKPKILLRKIMLDDDIDFIDFSGKSLNTKELSKKYDFKFTPTLIFFDAQGEEIGARMIGINTPEFYAGYLDQNIDEAYQSLQN